MDDLTLKQRAFVREYLIDLNASAAAERAGYSAKSAGKIGFQLLEKPRIQTAIRQAIDDRSKRTDVTADKVVQQLAKIAFADIKDVVEWSETGFKVRPSEQVDGTILSSISSSKYRGDIKKEVKLNDRMKALELLGRHLGMFVDKHELSGAEGEPLRVLLNVPEPKKSE